MAEERRLRADAQRNRDEILRVAIEQFAVHGISASLEDIARVSGVGPGTLYRHFPTREALIAAVLEERRSELLSRYDAARSLADADAALQSWLAALHDHLRRFRGLPQPVLQAFAEQASPLAITTQHLVDVTGEFLARAQQEGHGRAALKAQDLFFSVLGFAWIADRAAECGASAESLNVILRHGYLEQTADVAAR